MIIKGGARGGNYTASKLANYLSRPEGNEYCAVREVTGTVATDVLGALREMAVMGLVNSTTRPLYALSINADPGERQLAESDKGFAVDHLETKLGLTGQPRIVIEHQKKQRWHIHVVWSRVSMETGRCIHDGHDATIHKQAARLLEFMFRHQHVRNLEAATERSRTTEADLRQAERTGLSAFEIADIITDAWAATRNGRRFQELLSTIACILVRGDRRDFVVIDPLGGAHSVGRIKRVSAEELRTRMSDLDPKALPSVREARRMQRARIDELFPTAPEIEPTIRRMPGPAAPAQIIGGVTPWHGAKGTRPRPIA